MSSYDNNYLGRLQYTQAAGTENMREWINRTFINGSEEEETRIAQYQLYWQFYLGNHWKEYNLTMLSFNYCKAFVDKVCQFLIGKTGFSLTVSAYHTEVIKDDIEKAAEALLLYHWNRNKLVKTCYELTQMGSICGDAWVLAVWDEVDRYVRLQVLDSRHCYPQFSTGDADSMTSFLVRTPMLKNGENYKLLVQEFTKDTVTTWYQKTTALRTPDKDKFEKRTVPHGLGFIPVVHFRNKPNSSGYYSFSDLQDLIKINKTYNELTLELKSIIDYHIAPVTVVTGASITKLPKKIGNVWSGFPEGATVQNLGLEADLSAGTEFLDRLKLGMHELGAIPENFLGKIQSISNTSAAALQLTYQPIVQASDEKWIMYGEGITELNKMILRYTRLKTPNNKGLKLLDAHVAEFLASPENLFIEITEDSDIPKFEDLYQVSPNFKYGFPQDEYNEANLAQIQLNLKVTSRKRIMEKLGVSNIPEVLAEIEQEALAEARLQRSIMEITAPPEIQGLGNPPREAPTSEPLPPLERITEDFLKN